MPPVVVQPVVPHAVVASPQHHVSVVMLNITRLPALLAGDRPPFHLFLVKIALFIAVIASRRNVPLVVPTVTARAAIAEVAMAVAEIVAVAVIDVIDATIVILAGNIT